MVDTWAQFLLAFFGFSEFCIPRMHFKIVPAVKMFFRTSKKVHYSEFRLFASLLLTQSPFFSGEFAQSWCQNDLQSLPLKTQRPESQAAVCTVIYVWVESTFSHAERDKGTSLQNPECVCMSVREAQNCSDSWHRDPNHCDLSL